MAVQPLDASQTSCWRGRRFVLAIGAAAAALLLVGGVLSDAATAQQDLTPEQMKMLEQVPAEHREKAMEQMRKQGMGGQQPGGKPANGEKKEEGEKKPGEEGKKEEKEEEAKTIKRPTDKPQADAAELKVTPDKDGMVQFNFRGQPWLDVMEWFAGVANYSFDYQELPADFLNLSTQRRHTIKETQDLLNRHLLARKFTMVVQGDGLTVVKIDKLDPSLVPRVAPEELDDHLPHEFVKTRFAIPESMDPAKAVEDVRILLSATAKATPLLATRQLQVIDAVTNLRDVRDLLEGERLATLKDIRPRPFEIRHRRADYVADQVMIVLGLDPASRKSPQELQIEQQRMQLYMQMQQKGTDISKMIKQDGPAVFIAVDKRRNVLLVNAPPKEMVTIERTIEQFDVPESGLAAGAAAGDQGLTLKRHSTVSVTPDAVVTALKEMGDLDPLTQLQSDARSKTIFAYATPADHATIVSMIDKLDGTGRKLRPIWLNRRASADQVAGTITALMVGEKKKDDNNRYRYWSPWDYGGGDDEGEDAGFRIQADIENNRLLLWANEDEFAEVTALLKELGAIASNKTTNPNKFRVLEARTPEETAELLKRLEQAWGGQNQLKINVAPPVKADPAKQPAQAEPVEEPAPSNKDKLTKFEAPREGGVFSLAVNRAAGSSAPVVFVAEQVGGAGEPDAPPVEAESVEAEPVEAAAGESAEPTSPETKSVPGAARTPPPVNITVMPDGRIIISSDDAAALDQVEEMLEELEPPRQDFAVFQLYNSRASLVVLNLNEYFADEIEDESESFFDLWDDGRRDEDPATLGKRRKLRFIWDSDTNTIVAQNATPAQLQVIRKLIEIYDQAVSEDSVAKRRTDIVPINYSRAEDIATAIKEVYRDLLSSKDKEFQGRDGDDRDRGRGRGESWSFFGGSSSAKSAPMKMSFEGALSIGVDEISNSLIICAEEGIWENVRDLAVSLDLKAKSDTIVQVHEVRGIDPEELQDALEDALSNPWPGGKPLEASSQRGGDRGGGDRGRDRGDRGDRGGDGDRRDRD